MRGPRSERGEDAGCATQQRCASIRGRRIRDAHRAPQTTTYSATGPNSVEVLDDLVGSRPLLGRNDEIDISSPEAIRGPIGDAARVDTHLSELVAPCQRGLLILERADRLPALQARVVDGH